MTDLLGHGAFGAARSTTTRPPVTPGNAPGDPDTWAKDCTSPAAADGTEHRAGWANFLLAQLRNAIRGGGVAESNTDDEMLARAIQSGRMNYIVATGTANAWLVAPSLALLAYAAGRVLWIVAPATNTATAVTANVSGLGTRTIVKSDGSAPGIGDIVTGRIYPTIDDGTSIRVVAPLPSDRLGTPYLGFHGDPVSQAFASAAVARVVNYTGIVNNLPGASHTAGTITIGTTGYYQVTANMAALLPDVGANYGSTIAVSKVDASNVVIASVVAASMECLTTSFSGSRANSASGIVKLTAGERIAAFFGQNSGAARNMSISFDIEFRGA